MYGTGPNTFISGSAPFGIMAIVYSGYETCQTLSITITRCSRSFIQHGLQCM